MIPTPRFLALAGASILAVVAGGCPRTPTTTTEPVARPEPAIAADLAFVGADVFDGTTWIDDAVVLVAGERIVAVGRDVALPASAKVVDGEGMSLLPGLIDAHVHVHTPGDPKQALAFGVTTELDMFTDPALVAQLREPSATRADVISAGILATTPGGHGTEYGWPIPTLTRPEEADAFVAARVAEGSAFLKIVVDDGAELGLKFTTFDAPTVKALVTAAHERKLRTAVHVGTLADAEVALAAGADGLAHMFMDQVPPADFIARAKAAGLFVADTLPVLASVCGRGQGPELIADPRLSPLLRIHDRAALGRALTPPSGPPSCTAAFSGVGAFAAGGVPILASTDAPNAGTVHGASLLGELSLLVEAGLSPTAALSAATSNPAAAFGLDDRGRIEVGRRADLLLVRGDPRADITVVRDIVAVYKSGRAYDREPLQRIVELEQRQIEKQRAAPPPEGLAKGLVSSFDDGTMNVGFGAGWQSSTDQLQGGKSTATLTVVAEGKRNRALAVTGEIDPTSAPSMWAGASFCPGATPMAPANLTSVKDLVFRARGPGKIVVMLFATQAGLNPAFETIELTPKLAEHRVALRELVADPYDITMVFIGAEPRPGKFSFTIDDVRFE